MSLTDDMATYLLARVGLTNLVGTRIYPMLVPEGSDNYPAITYQTISVLSDVALDGPTGLGRVRVQVSCWARKYSDMEPVAAAVVDAMSGFKGLFATSTVQQCLKVNEVDLMDASPGLSPARLYGRAIDFQIWWNEPIPSYA